MMLKTLVGCMVLGCCVSAYASDWTEIDGAMPHGHVFVDAATVHKDADGITVWTKFVQDTPTMIPGSAGRYYSSIVSLDHLNCTDRTTQPMQSVIYGTENDIAQQTPYSKTRNPDGVIPGTTMEAILNFLCEARKQSNEQMAAIYAELAASSAASAPKPSKKVAKHTKAASSP
jgi:hypothetical protein